MYPEAFFQGFKWGLKNHKTAGAVPAELNQFSSWIDGFLSARHAVEDGRTAKEMTALCFQSAGYRQVQFRSCLDGVPEQCPECGEEMVMSAFEKDTPDGPRLTSYRVIGTCLGCFRIQEF